MSGRESIILFGEGKTEAIFLSHLHQLYRDRIASSVKIACGRGGSPKTVAERLISQHLSIASFDRSLLLLDQDRGYDEIPKSWLRDHDITLACSNPCCLEGVFLTLLNDLPPRRDRHRSEAWKKHFWKNHLGTNRSQEVQSRLKQKSPSLFPKDLIERNRTKVPALKNVLAFLGV